MSEPVPMRVSLAVLYISLSRTEPASWAFSTATADAPLLPTPLAVVTWREGVAGAINSAWRRQRSRKLDQVCGITEKR